MSADAFRPGFEIGTWAEEKLARATQHLRDLETLVGVWVAGTGADRHVEISEDRLAVRVFVHLTKEPPVGLWSLTLGDCVHNLRSALDAVTWNLATLNGAEPPRPGRIQFPITKSASAWHRVADDLGTIPQVALERIRLTQPYLLVDPDSSAISLLHQIDIWDKHRSLVEIGFAADVIDLAGVELELADPKKAVGLPELSIAEGLLASDEPLLTIKLNAEVKSAKAPMDFSIVPMLSFGDRRLNLFEALSAMRDAVRVCLSLIKYGPEDNPELEKVNEDRSHLS